MPKLSVILCSMFFAGMIAVANAAPPSPTTQSFVQSAAVSNQFEISASRLALQNSQNDAVKSFAQSMVKDHTQLSKSMKMAVSDAHLDGLPHSSHLDSAHRKILKKLNKAKGQDFDKIYIANEVKGHKQNLALFTDYAADGDNQSLRNFAAEALPMLQQHEQDVEALSQHQ